MDRIAVNEDQYIALCNEELKRHELYEEDMEIINVPESATNFDASGYGWTGPEHTSGIVADVVGIVNRKYRLQVTYRIK